MHHWNHHGIGPGAGLASLLLLAGCGAEGETTDGASHEALDWPALTRQEFDGPPPAWEVHNAEAPITSQCYTRTEGKYNPCYTCHQSYPHGSRPNAMNDGYLQGEYAFSDVGLTNHWDNLFVDRRDAVAAIPDEAVIEYIHEDNYRPFRQAYEAGETDWDGYFPVIEDLASGADAFDDQGFARDGSGWVAFNYKPLPSTFWPTNGSTDDVMIRLAEPFRTARDCSGIGTNASRDVYLANLALAEMAIKGLDRVDSPLINEAAVCVDLDGDGDVHGMATEVRWRDRYVGGAHDVPTARQLYPAGTEFLHTVRYVGVNDDGEIDNAPRMKEVRYMRKHRFYDPADLRAMYGNEHQEKIDGNLPRYHPVEGGGLNNGFGWQVLGFIEDAGGELRPQTHEEQKFCMGCHTTIGTTIDQTFAFGRKVTGAEGWGYIDTRGMADAPSITGDEGEILQYLRRVGGGDEFRENEEMRARWFDDDGNVLEEKVRAADVHELITPSRERALALNKAYWLITKAQSFVHGRDATIAPAANVYREIPADTPPLAPEHRYLGPDAWDLRLDWSVVD